MIVAPSSQPTLTGQVAEALQENTSIRVGTVVAHRPSGLTLNVGGGLVSASFLASYEPFVGDVVSVARQEATWLVLGSMGTPAPDLSALPNYSFEDGAVGAVPPNWQLVTTAGAPSLTTESWTREDFVDGVQVGRVTAGSTASITCEVVSDPVPTLGGEIWSASAMVIASDTFGATTAAAVELRIGWYSSDSLASLLATNASASYAIGRGVPWRLIRVSGQEGYTAVAGANFLRVKLAFSWSATASESISFDRFIARRIS